MQLYSFPSRENWPNIIKRPVMSVLEIYGKVQPILDAVRDYGDEALRTFTQKFDGVELTELSVGPSEWADGMALVDEDLRSAIQTAADNIRTFHQAQVQLEQKVETMPGVVCWRRSAAIDRVGFYIPGGTAPLFSTVLMLAVPASIAGCKEVILCTPPQKNGKVHPAVLYAAYISGVTRIIKAGGAQAIAAMAHGTPTVPAVRKIFGPGNQYVMAAKQLVQQLGVAIDMPAGPSEVCVMADETAVPAYVAADLLSQAEHGADSQVLLVATSKFDINALISSLETQLGTLPRASTAEQALRNSRIVIMDNVQDMMELVNDYAPEHLIISMQNAEQIAASIVNAGSIFIGNLSPESVGDYASGTNHTLPTNGYAAAFSGVSVDSFVKKITVQQLSEQGLQNIAPAVIAMATAEGLEAHAQAVKIRLQFLNT